MSMLDQAAARRVVARLNGPPPRNAEAAAAWERGEAVEWRWAACGDRWKLCERARAFGMHTLICTPNWLNDEIEFRIAATK